VTRVDLGREWADCSIGGSLGIGLAGPADTRDAANGMRAIFTALQERGWVGHHDPVTYRIEPQIDALTT
jgi:hypothetical protein